MFLCVCVHACVCVRACVCVCVCLITTHTNNIFLLHHSLKLECEKLASDKTEMQRHYVMVSHIDYVCVCVCVCVYVRVNV